jgi:hypothetical protein
MPSAYLMNSEGSSEANKISSNKDFRNLHSTKGSYFEMCITLKYPLNPGQRIHIIDFIHSLQCRHKPLRI